MCIVLYRDVHSSVRFNFKLKLHSIAKYKTKFIKKLNQTACLGQTESHKLSLNLEKSKATKSSSLINFPFLNIGQSRTTKTPKSIKKFPFYFRFKWISSQHI